MFKKFFKVGISGALAASIAVLVLWPAGAAAAPVASLTPASHDFGQQVVDTQSANFDFTLANTGDGAITVASVEKAGANPGQFNLKAATDCETGVVLDGVDPECQIRVSFDPGSLGAKVATIEVVTDLSVTPLTVQLSGTSVPAPAVVAGISSVAVPFDERRIDEGPSVARTVILTSLGSIPLAVGAISADGADPSQFVTDAPKCQNLTLNQNQACTFTVAFDPDSAGPKRAGISIATNAPNSPTVVNLAGTATAPPGPSGSARVKILPKLPRVRMNPLKLPFGCVLAGSAKGCSGRITVRTTGAALGRNGKARKRVYLLGRGNYSVRAARGTASVKLKRFALDALRKRGRLPLRLSVAVRQPDGSFFTRTIERTMKGRTGD